MTLAVLIGAVMTGAQVLAYVVRCLFGASMLVGAFVCASGFVVHGDARPPLHSPCNANSSLQSTP